MYFLDRVRGQDGSDIRRTKTGFAYSLQRHKTGEYKVQSGELIRVCMTSDFFLEEADEWRSEAWEIMRRRRDVKFFLLTKRPQRVGCYWLFKSRINQETNEILLRKFLMPCVRSGVLSAGIDIGLYSGEKGDFKKAASVYDDCP